jgi:GNAT superfamily N-acetyltransferase
MAQRPAALGLRAIEDAGEARALAALVARAASELAGDLGQAAPPDAAAALARRLERTPGSREGLLLVAETARTNAPRGLCWVTPFEDPLTGESLPLIAVLWVVPDERQRGLGRALVREAGRLLAARGVRSLAARAGHNDDVLISMGERWGFVRRWELMVRE